MSDGFKDNGSQDYYLAIVHGAQLSTEVYVARNEYRYLSGGGEFVSGCILTNQGVLRLTGEFWRYIPKADHKVEDILPSLQKPGFGSLKVTGGSLRVYGDLSAASCAQRISSLQLYRLS